MNKKWISVIGVAATVLGAGLSLVSNWVSDKKMEETVNEKVMEAIANLNEK